MYDVAFINGKIVDGTGSPWFYADIGIMGDEIVFIGTIKKGEAKEIYDVCDLTISPGFIDMHCHSDLFILENPYLSAKIRQGITTDLLGQDGISAAPLSENFIHHWKRNLSGLDGEPEIEWDWSDVGSYFKKIELNKPSYNLAYLVPHGNLRMKVVGLEDRKANANEIKQMQQILRDSLDQGACGLSSGLIYLPCMYADYNEIEALCEVAAAYGVPFVVHQRSEGDEILESMDELIEVTRKTGVHLHFSHFKVCGKKNWNKTNEVLQKLDKARKEGLEVTFDQYPYTAGSTMLSAILPPWVHDGGTEYLMKRLQDEKQRKRISDEMKAGFKGWDSIYAWAGSDGIYVTSVSSSKNQEFVGKNLSEISTMRKEKDAIETALHLIMEENNAVGMIDFVMDESSVSQIMSHPAGTICTDGLLGGEPHPRAYGSFPRVLGKYIREENVLSMEDMIRRMTSQPARILGLQDRGILREGLKADIVIFDEKTIIDSATYENPRQFPVGIHYVIVNGKVIFDNGKSFPIHAGKVLRRKF